MAPRNSSAETGDDDPLVVAYRHDAHKLNRVAHDDADGTFEGIAVNRTVPFRADADAAALSRPPGEQELTVPAHRSHARLSLVTGESRFEGETLSDLDIDEARTRLLTSDDPRRLHRAWLESDVASAFNESVFHPYTSLKYHTLLVAALLDNYRAENGFVDLQLVVDPPDEIIPHRTVFAGERFALRIDATGDDRPHAGLGPRPWRSWATTWKRLTAHPLDTGDDRHDMVLDANLRRIWSWSTALQYLEDVEREGRP